MYGGNRRVGLFQQKKQIVAVFGTEKSVGVTSLCVALAAMASSGKNTKVLLLEMGNQHTFVKIRRFYDRKMLSTDGEFQMDRIRFYPDTTIEKALDLIAQEDVFIILDCGKDVMKYQEVLKFCTRKILLCSLLPWKIQQVIFLLTHEKCENLWDCALVTSGKSQLQKIKRITGYSMKPWIFIEEPLSLKKHDMEELYQLIYGKKYITNRC